MFSVIFSSSEICLFLACQITDSCWIERLFFFYVLERQSDDGAWGWKWEWIEVIVHLLVCSPNAGNSQELLVGLWCECWVPECLSHYLLPSGMYRQWRHNSSWGLFIGDVAISSNGLTYCATHHAWELNLEAMHNDQSQSKCHWTLSIFQALFVVVTVKLLLV